MTSGIHAVNDQHFAFDKDNRMVCKIRGVACILFYAQGNDACREFEPVFKDFARREVRAKCFIAEQQQVRRTIADSRTSQCQIKMLPLMIVFVEGKPLVRQNPAEVEKLMAAVTAALNQSKSAQVPQGPGRNPAGVPSGSGYQNAPQNNIYAPNLGSGGPPKGALRGGKISNGPSYSNDEDDGLGGVPPGVLPHNAPWLKNDDSMYD